MTSRCKRWFWQRLPLLPKINFLATISSVEIEQECLEVYKRKVDKANEGRSELQSQIISIEAEIEGICATLGTPCFKDEKKNVTVNLKEKIEIITPLLVEMRKRKADRKKQFLEILSDLRSISKEIFGATDDSLNEMVLDDLSLKRLEELHIMLREFKAEKLPGIAKMFSSEMTLASAWIHLLVVDLFAARQVYQDGLENEIETRHSVSFCLLFCPVGIISHVITKALTKSAGSTRHGI